MPTKKKKDEELLPEDTVPTAESEPETSMGTDPPVTEEAPAKPKRTRSRKAAAEQEPEVATEEETPLAPKPTRARGQNRNNDLLTISDEERGFTIEDDEETKWTYLKGAAARRVILTGVIGSVERLSEDIQVAVVNYEGVRILIPVKEMFLEPWPEDNKPTKSMLAKLDSMLGAKVDFILSAVDVRGHAAVASRKAAMLERQRRYYATGRIEPGIRVACRVIRVGDRFAVVEAFGVEAAIAPNEMSREWYNDITKICAVGDLAVARVMSVERDPETGYFSAELSLKRAQERTNKDIIRTLTPDSSYFGVVTNVTDGVIFVRLQAGANAKTRSFNTKVIPSIHDTVSFRIKRIDEETGVATGYISRIVKRHSKLG